MTPSSPKRGTGSSRRVPCRWHPIGLGLSGVCDVVEFTRIAGWRANCRAGTACICLRRWSTNAARKSTTTATKRSCAPRRCAWKKCSRLTIPYGYLYYGETRHRVAVELTAELRNLVQEMAEEMHNYFQQRLHPARQTVQRLPLLFAGGYLPARYCRRKSCRFEIHQAADREAHRP